MIVEHSLRSRFTDVLKTVAAGFLGVRRRTTHESESAPIKPAYIIIAGIIAAAIFVMTLVGLARWVAG